MTKGSFHSKQKVSDAGVFMSSYINIMINW